jgi:hypothetical protein
MKRDRVLKREKAIRMGSSKQKVAEFHGLVRVARSRQAGLDAAAAKAVACGYTGKEVGPAYAKRLFQLFAT